MCMGCRSLASLRWKDTPPHHSPARCSACSTACARVWNYLVETIAVRTMPHHAYRLQHTIKSPGCRRKLCEVALGANAKPVAEIRNSTAHDAYDLELRCGARKAFVGVKFG